MKCFTTMSTEDSGKLIRHGVVPAMVKVVLAAEESLIAEQAVWTLANLAADCVESRDTVLESGLVGHLIDMLYRT